MATEVERWRRGCQLRAEIYCQEIYPYSVEFCELPSKVSSVTVGRTDFLLMILRAGVHERVSRPEIEPNIEYVQYLHTSPFHIPLPRFLRTSHQYSESPMNGSVTVPSHTLTNISCTHPTSSLVNLTIFCPPTTGPFGAENPGLVLVMILPLCRKKPGLLS